MANRNDQNPEPETSATHAAPDDAAPKDAAPRAKTPSRMERLKEKVRKLQGKNPDIYPMR